MVAPEARVWLDRATVPLGDLEELILDEQQGNRWRCTLYYRADRFDTLIDHLGSDAILHAPRPDAETPSSMLLNVPAADVVTTLARCRRQLARFYGMQTATLTYVSRANNNLVVELLFNADDKSVTITTDDFVEESLQSWLDLLHGAGFYTSSRAREEGKLELMLAANAPNDEYERTLLAIATALFSVTRRPAAEAGGASFVSASVGGYDNVEYPVTITVVPTAIFGYWECRIYARHHLGARLRQQLGEYHEHQLNEPFVFTIVTGSVFTVLARARKAMPPGGGFGGKTTLAYDNKAGNYTTVTFDVTVVGDDLMLHTVQFKRSGPTPRPRFASVRRRWLAWWLKHKKLVRRCYFVDDNHGEVFLPFDLKVTDLVEACRTIAGHLAK